MSRNTVFGVLCLVLAGGLLWQPQVLSGNKVIAILLAVNCGRLLSEKRGGHRDAD